MPQLDLKAIGCDLSSATIILPIGTPKFFYSVQVRATLEAQAAPSVEAAAPSNGSPLSNGKPLVGASS